MTKIAKLPATIARISSLEEVYVKETPLKQPKLAVAMRGINAIREFFQQNEEDFDDADVGAVDEGPGGRGGAAEDTADSIKKSIKMQN